MPIDRYKENHSPLFFEPEETTEVGRYLNITKFLSLLKNRQLFFCRLDKLEDKFEGTMPKMSKKELTDWYRYMRDVKNFYTVPMSDEMIEKSVDEDFEFREKLKSLNCVNCWNEFNGESYALWKIYSDLNQGIMIKSTFSKIIKAFSETKENLYCSRINYINYDTDSINIGNTMTPIVHKQKAYSYEQEIRLIHKVSNEGWKHNWDDEKYHNGIMIDVNVQELISEIVISPFSPDWFIELVKDVLEKYSINCKLKNSKLR